MGLRGEAAFVSHGAYWHDVTVAFEFCIPQHHVFVICGINYTYYRQDHPSALPELLLCKRVRGWPLYASTELRNLGIYAHNLSNIHASLANTSALHLIPWTRSRSRSQIPGRCAPR